MTEFAQKLNALLNRQPENTAVIARLAGISPDDISKYKRGNRFPENEERVSKLLSAIRCSAAARDEVKAAWTKEYMSRKYKKKDAWNCIEEIYQFLQSESLTSEISLCKKDMLNLGFVGGVIYGDLDVRRYLMSFLNNAQKSQIKICGNEDFVENLSSIPYTKGIQYLHVIHSENTTNVSKWIHTVCGMLLRMIDCPQYTPLIVYGTDRWEGQLFSGAVISEQEVFFVSEDAKQGMILRNADQIKFVNHYFAKMSENGKKIAVPVKREKLYETADNNVMCIQNWIELDHISPKKGIRYITTDAVKSFVEKESLWHCFKNDWFQYTLKSGKKKILEEILDDSNSILIDSVLMQLRKNLKVELCEDRFFYISVADTGGIWTYEVCVPELIQWFGYALKEMADSEFVMTEERKRQFLSQMMKNAELEDKKDV